MSKEAQSEREPQDGRRAVANRSENVVYRALEAVETLKREIIALGDAMASSRADVEKHMREGNADKARACHDALRSRRARLAEAIDETRLPLLETGDPDLAAYAGRLSENLSAFNLMTKDYGALRGAISAYAARLPEHDTVSAATVGRLMNGVRMGHYPTDLLNVSHILKAVAFPRGVVTNLLDPCCGEGKALKRMAAGNNCFAYGVEIDERRAEKAQSELHRVGFGSFFHCRISREAFHLVFLNPPYLSVISESGGRARNEKRFLIDGLPCLMTGGLLIYVIPHHRLTGDVCRILADNLTDVSVHAFTPEEFKKFGQIVVMGLRRKKTDGSAEADALSKLAYFPERLPCVTELAAGRYRLPASARKVETFNGAVFNERELARQLTRSKSFDAFTAKKTQTEGIRRPPLPFSFSQLGLIGGSGLINGLIDCDTPHIIKGRIVKEVRSESTDDFDADGRLVSTEIVEKVSNRMIFGILAPGGHKSLA